MRKPKANPKGVVIPEVETLRNEVTERTSAMMLRVTNDATYQQAGGLLKWCKAALEEAGRIFDPIVSAANKAHKVALSQRNEVTGPVKRLDTHLRSELAGYAQRKENERRIAEENALAAQQSQAAALEAGEEVEFAPSTETAVAKTAELPSVEGLGFRDGWDFKVTALASIPREYLMADEAKIKAVVQQLGKSAETVIPGIEVVSVKIPVQR